MGNNPKHHRRSIRLKGYDYSQEGLYFITTCTHKKECLFGEVVDDEMILNDAGFNADNCWREIPIHFPNAVLHEHVVMPNHVHGIIELRTDNNVMNAETGIVGAENLQPLQYPHVSPKQYKQHEFQKMIPRSISSIVKGFKIGVTKWFRNGNPAEFTQERKIWQRNFHDHIIRDEQSYLRITTYIINNPRNWKNDMFWEQ